MTDAPVDTLTAMLIPEEGLRLKPYRDTVGKLTIGVGRNLDDVGISQAEAMAMLANDIARSDAALYKGAPWAKSMDAVRRDVLRDMAFNMGWGSLSKFTSTLMHARSGDYVAAAADMLKSEWAGQVGSRAWTLAKMMKTGERP